MKRLSVQLIASSVIIAVIYSTVTARITADPCESYSSSDDDSYWYVFSY